MAPAPMTTPSTQRNLTTSPSTMTTPSRTSTSPSSSLRTVKKKIHHLIRLMRATNMVSANQCGSVIKSITQAYPPAHGSEKPQIVSHELVNRAIVKGDVVHYIWLADQMALSSQIFLCIDESSKVMGQSFVKIEISGQYLDNRKTAWFSLLVVQEVVSHMASKMAQIIADELQHINAIQQSRNLHKTRIYEIIVITFDLTSANTGWLGGLGHKLDKKSTKMWENNKAANKIPSWLRD